MQPEPFGARQQVRLAPTLGGAVTAAGKQAVEHRQVDGPFDVKLEAAPLEQGAQRLRDAAFLPQAPEDQVRSDAAHGHRLGFTGRMGVQHGQALALAHARAHQPIQLAALLQQIQSAQGGNDLLADFLPFPDAVRDLEVTVRAGGFDAEEHGRISLGLPPATTPPVPTQQKRRKRAKNLHYILEFLTPQSPARPLWERIQHFCRPDNCSRSV
jgi:hypothetical protein